MVSYAPGPIGGAEEGDGGTEAKVVCVDWIMLVLARCEG